MGLFSGTTIYQAFSASSQLLEEENYKDTLKEMVLSAIMHPEEEDLRENIIGASVLSFAYKVRRYQSYGAGDYYWGLPTNTFTGMGFDPAIVEAVLESIYTSADCDVVLGYLGFPQPRFVAEKYLADNFTTGWDDVAEEDVPWNRVLSYVRVPDLEHYPDTHPDTEPTEIVPNVWSIKPHVTLENYWDIGFYYNTWIWDDVAEVDVYTQLVRKVASIPVTGTGIYYQIVFTRSDLEGYFYWEYLAGAGTYPSLDLEADDSEESTYLPIAILLKDEVPFNDVPTSDQAITTNRLLRKLWLSADDVLEKALDGDTEDAEKYDFFLHFAVPLFSNYMPSKRYLFAFFEHLRNYETYNRTAYANNLELLENSETDCITDENCLGSIISNSYGVHVFSEIEILEGTTRGYVAAYRWNYIDKKTVSGTILAQDGDVSIDVYPGLLSAAAYRDVLELYYGAVAQTEDFLIAREHDIIILKKRISSTSYEMMLIMGLTMAYKINLPGDDATVEITVRDTNRVTEFVIPIKWDIAEQFNSQNRELLFQDSFHGTLFLVNEVDVPWYASTWFKILVIICVIAFLIFAPLVAIQGFLASSLGVSPSLALMMAKFVVGFVISFAAAIIGGPLGAVFGLVLSIYTMGGSVALQALIQEAIQGAMMSALQLLNLVTKVLQVGIQYVQQGRIEDLRTDMEQWTETHAEKQQELEDAWYGLRSIRGLDPWDIVRHSAANTGESAEGFYSRALTQDPGGMAIDVHDTLHEMSTDILLDRPPVNILNIIK